LLLAQNSAYSGISLMQGPHHVAQKSRTTTFPSSEERLTLPPARSRSSKAGAERFAAGDLVQATAARRVSATRVV
jgi:hypothetical protein